MRKDSQWTCSVEDDHNEDDSDLTYESSVSSDVTYDDLVSTVCVHNHDLSDLAETANYNIKVKVKGKESV